jgi:predicted permease
VRQVFTESLLLAAIGGALGLLLAQWVGPAGFSLATDDTGLRAIDLGPDRWMLASTAALSVLAGLTVGAAAVLRASAAHPQEALRNLRGHGAPRLTKALLTVQIALTVTLVGSAGLLLQTLTNFRRIDVGFEPKQLLTVTMDAGLGTFEPPRAAEYVRRAAVALAAVPGVHAVTYANRAIGTGVPINLTLDVPGFVGAPANSGSSGIISAGPAFIKTLGLTLLAGRDFEQTDREGSAPVAIVNESFATHFFGTGTALGQTCSFSGPGNRTIRIVGVVKDVRDGGVKRPTQQVMYIPFGQREVNTVTFTVRVDTALSRLSETIRRTLEPIDPAVGISKMWAADAQLDDVLRRERLLAVLGVAFGGLALLLLAVGLYGMLNAMVVRRTTEIGVRMALGATRIDIARMMARESVLILAGGLASGVAGYLAAGRLIQTELFGVTAHDATTAATAVVVLVVIAAVAVSVSTRRATRIDPAEALRYDHA